MKHFVLLCAAVVMAVGADAQRLQMSQVEDNARHCAEKMLWTADADLERVVLPGMEGMAAYNIAGGGFIVASTDSRTRPILAYSPTGTINPARMPENVRYWLGEYQRQISQLASAGLGGGGNAEAGAAKSLPDTVAPMLVTAWRQFGHGYNSMTPYDSTLAADSMCQGHPTVGCVPLAMAQVMRYWQFPAHGNRTVSVDHTGWGHWNYGTLTADLAGTTYDYANMPCQLTDTSTPEQVEAVATLLYHCGLAANANYNADGYGSTSANFNNVLYALTRCYHYNRNAYLISRSGCSYRTWADTVKNELAHGRPVLCTGGSHGFVFDGYDRDDYIHVNWGWNGQCDGYYSLDALCPSDQDDFTVGQRCIFGLEPSYRHEPMLEAASEVRLSGTVVSQGDPVAGTYSLTNLGDSLADYYVGVGVDTQWIDIRHVLLEPGDTLDCVFSFCASMPVESYYGVRLCYGADSVPQNMTYLSSVTEMYVYGSSQDCMSNVVAAVRFADDSTFSPADYANSMVALGARCGDVCSFVEPFLSVSSRIADHFENGALLTYQDAHPYSYYLPYSADNPDGDPQPWPEDGFTERQTQLIANLVRYADSAAQFANPLSLDANRDGVVDNLMLFTPHDKPLLLAKEVSAADGITLGQSLVKTVNIIPAIDHSPTVEDEYAMLRELLYSCGYPRLSHRYNHVGVHPCDGTDVLDNGTLPPSAMVKYKYCNRGIMPIRITQDGTYSIEVGNNQKSYYIASVIDSNQWYTIEGVYWEDNNHWVNGLQFGRWVDTLPLNRFFGGNGLFDYPGRPNVFWLFRPGSDNDTVSGTHSPYWLLSNPMSSFGPDTDPHPYLADGTPERSFEIYDIQIGDGRYQFSVRFLHGEGIDAAGAMDEPRAFPNPTTGVISLKGVEQGTSIRVYNSYGTQLLDLRYDGSRIDLGGMPAGFYILRTPTAAMKVVLSR